MQITAQQLQAEAGELALECRLKDKVITALRAQNEALQKRVADLEPEDPKPGTGDAGGGGAKGDVAAETTPRGVRVRDKRAATRQQDGEPATGSLVSP